ncbi:unnamed protein product [Brassica oleracea var. botrytis]
MSNNNGHSLRKIDRFLNAIWGLSPKIMVVTEQHSDHNGSTLMQRLLESLYSYAALFDCLENKIPRTSQDRIKVEKMLFGEEIKNIIACEGSERRERHEKLEKWSQRIDLAGFGNVPLSYYVMLQARRINDAIEAANPMHIVCTSGSNYTKTGLFKFFSHDLKTQNCCKK